MEEVLKTSQRACTVRAYLGWKHHGVNITTSPTTLPPLPGWNASPSQHCPPACFYLTQKKDLCVCWGGRGEGCNVKKRFLSEKIKWWNREGLNPTPHPTPDLESDVITIPPPTFRKPSQNLKSNLTTWDWLDKHYSQLTDDQFSNLPPSAWTSQES